MSSRALPLRSYCSLIRCLSIYVSIKTGLLGKRQILWNTKSCPSGLLIVLYSKMVYKDKKGKIKLFLLMWFFRKKRLKKATTIFHRFFGKKFCLFYLSNLSSVTQKYSKTIHHILPKFFTFYLKFSPFSTNFLFSKLTFVISVLNDVDNAFCWYK